MATRNREDYCLDVFNSNIEQAVAYAIECRYQDLLEKIMGAEKINAKQVQELLDQRATIIKALQYHLNETARLKDRMNELEELFNKFSIDRPVLPRNMAWILESKKQLNAES
jgi:hypothetical protein